jgi:dTDP-6-deoxy-L-talose 4-dehydrogenase (NAD+)
MKIAIVGASGFIGKKLCEQVSKVKTLKVLATYNKNKPKIKNITFIKLDIRKKKKNYFKILKKPDLLIHLAWSDLESFDSNVHIKKILPQQKYFLKNLIKNGLKNLVVTGTCFEYGKSSGKIKENHSTKPLVSYAKAKNYLRIFLFNLKRKNQFNLTWLRLFYIYGINSSRNTLTNLLINSRVLNNYISVNKSIQRDYLSVNDVAKRIIFVALKKKNFGLLNICSGKSITLKKLIKILKRKYNIKPLVKFNKFNIPKYEAVKFCGNNKKFLQI